MGFFIHNLLLRSVKSEQSVFISTQKQKKTKYIYMYKKTEPAEMDWKDLGFEGFEQVANMFRWNIH